MTCNCSKRLVVRNAFGNDFKTEVCYNMAEDNRTLSLSR